MANNLNHQNLLVKILGGIIKKHREEQEKSIYKISAEAYMSKSTWREAELGICKDITLSTLWKISDGLDIPLSDIIYELENNIDNKFSYNENF